MEDAKRIQNILINAGFNTLACGGFVRDYLLNVSYKDIDLATTAKPEEVENILFYNNIITIPTGLKYGTITALLNNKTYEITTLRKDVDCDGRHAKIEFTKSFKKDANRRDFTINALFIDLNNNKIYDYVNGQDDLNNKKLRFVGDAEKRIKEDYLRILRLYRFKSQLGFDIDNDAYIKSKKYINYLTFISIERIRNELLKLIIGNYFDKIETWIITYFFPELIPSLTCLQNCQYHNLNVLFHTLKGVNYLKKYKDSILSLSHLFHDIAKPLCKSTDGDIFDHFYEHEIYGVNVVKKICHRLKISNKDTNRIKFLVKNHMLLHSTNIMNKRSLRKIYNKCLENNQDIEDLFKLFLADFKGMNKYANEKFEPKKRINKYREIVKEFSKKIINSPLSGNEIMHILNIKEGKKIGIVKKYLIKEVIDGKLNENDKEKSIELIKSFDFIKFEIDNMEEICP